MATPLDDAWPPPAHSAWPSQRRPSGFRADVEGYLPHLDVFALSSFTEGLPVVVLEAMAASLPVVATAVGGVPEVVEDGVTGRLVEANDAPALARALLDVAADEDERRAMGERGRRRVVLEFDFDAQAKRYAEVFDALLASRSA